MKAPCNHSKRHLLLVDNFGLACVSAKVGLRPTACCRSAGGAPRFNWPATSSPASAGFPVNQTQLIAPRASSSISPRPMPLLGSLSLAGGSTGTKPAVSASSCGRAPTPRRRAALCGTAVSLRAAAQLAVGPAARRNYETAFGEFLRWSVSAGFPDVNEKNVEECLLGFLDHLLEEGSALYKAEISIASVADAVPELGMLASRLRLRRALRGFRKQRPPRSRAPVAKEIMAAIVNMLMNNGHSAMAPMVLIMFFSYCRPGEMRP